MKKEQTEKPPRGDTARVALLAGMANLKVPPERLLGRMADLAGAVNLQHSAAPLVERPAAIWQWAPLSAGVE